METVDTDDNVPVVDSSTSKRSVKRIRSAPRTNLHCNAWRLIDSEFSNLNTMFSFTLEACCDPDGKNKHGSLPFYSENDSFLSHDVSGQSVYCNPPWSLAVQCIDHLRQCHSQSPLDTKAVIILPDWPQFKSATSDLKLLRQIPKEISVFTKPSPSGTRHTLVKVPWPINYWVIDKDTPIKVPLITMQPIPVGEPPSTTDIPEMAAHWFPIASALTILDPNQPSPLMKLPISLMVDSNSISTTALIDSAASLNFVSIEFLTRNSLLEKCSRGPKIAVRIANEQRISTTKTFSP